MHRFYVDPGEIRNGLAALTPDDARHALRVLRLHPGSEAEILSGGHRYSAVLAEAEGNEVIFSLGSRLPSTEPALKITLFQGLPKAEKMDWVVQKAVEIGVFRIVPVRMARCVVRLDDRDAMKKQERWQRIAREAGKQSGRCEIPDVSLPVSLPEALIAAGDLDACVVPWEEAQAAGPKSWLAAHSALHSLGILIGPEGGIERDEISLLRSRFDPLTLGPRILRTETAGLTAAAVFLALCGEMEAQNPV